MEKSGYWVRKVGTEAEGEGLYRAVVHTNSYNLKYQMYNFWKYAILHKKVLRP